jgi:hypothetical protein
MVLLVTANNRSLNGLGDPDALMKVYIANQPSYYFANTNPLATESIIPIEKNELYECGQACGNGWRKVFNVYAKFVFALSNNQFGVFTDYTKWQEYRDCLLLRKNSKTALLFAEPALTPLNTKSDAIHIVMGKAYAHTLLEKNLIGNPYDMIWLNTEFALNTKLRVIICPYFDYRQLSNLKILYLVELVQSHFYSTPA